MNQAIRVVFLCFCLPFRLRGRPRCFCGVSRARLALMLEKTRLAGDTDADIGVEMTVGTLVACCNVDQALSLGFGLARARGQQDCLQHQERLLSSG